jgi:hypothetical protein
MKDDVKLDLKWVTWLLWEPDDPAWEWFYAVVGAETFADPKIIELIMEHVPEQAQPFVADFLDRNLKLRKKEQQQRYPRGLWAASSHLALAGRYVYMIKKKLGLELGDAVDFLFARLPAFEELIGPNARQKLYDHCSGKTGFGQIEKKRLKKITSPGRVGSEPHR